MKAIDQEPGGLSGEAVRRKLGRNLAALRDHREWSQEKLARRLGVTRGRLSKWETGEHAPPVEWLPALATALGVGLEKILEGVAPSLQPRQHER